LLVNVVTRASDADDRGSELAELARSAGYEVAAAVTAKVVRPDPALFIGRGKAQQIGAEAAAHAAATTIVGIGLSAVQQRNLELELGLPVVDRPQLILDIFGQRARSREGKVQVELAQLEHLATRLVRGWTHLERQRGGIGLRGGPGEKQLELDRRMIAVRTRQLKSRLEALRKQRATQRRARDRRGVFSISLVGYTNAGKSTLFNALAGAGSFAADQLFATLDPLSRRIRLEPDAGTDCVLTDTVGFIRDLPPQLVAAFKSTLEESAEADLLLHVIDAASPARTEQIAEVERILDEIGAGGVPRIAVYNKIDRAGIPPEVRRDPCGTIAAVFLSALSGDGIDSLRAAIAERIRDRSLEPSDTGREDGSREVSEREVSDPEAVEIALDSVSSAASRERF
jgi:GTP-binding protein HflX